MTSEHKGGENRQMDEIATEQVNARLAWFLAGTYAGGAKRKRIARDFDVSPDTAKGWLNGAGPGRRHFDKMVAKWGRDFLRFVYPTPLEEHTAEMQNIAMRLARIEGLIGAEMDRGEDAGPAPAEVDAAAGRGRAVDGLGQAGRAAARVEGAAAPAEGGGLAGTIRAMGEVNPRAARR